MRIRAAREGDAAAVTALWTEAYAGRHRGEGRQVPYEESEFRAVLGAGRLWVAVDDVAGKAKSVVGAVALQPVGSTAKTIARAGEAEFGRLAVSKASRERGAGRALVELAIAQAREWGADAVALWSRPYQTEAHRIYESLGFCRVPERDSRDELGERRIFVLGLADGDRVAP